MMNFKRTKKIDFRTFIDGSPNEKPSSLNNICKNSMFSLGPVYVPGGDIAFYGLLATAGFGVLMIGFSYLERMALKNGRPTSMTIVLDVIQTSLPFVFGGIVTYLILTGPILGWIL